MKIQTTTIYASIFALIAFMLFVAWKGSPGGAVFLLPFYAGPILVTLLLSSKFKTIWAQTVLLVSLPVYFAWIGYDLYNAFFVNLDPQSGIVLIVVGFMSLPVMIPLWIASMILNSYCAASETALSDVRSNASSPTP